MGFIGSFWHFGCCRKLVFLDVRELTFSSNLEQPLPNEMFISLFFMYLFNSQRDVRNFVLTSNLFTSTMRKRAV